MNGCGFLRGLAVLALLGLSSSRAFAADPVPPQLRLSGDERPTRQTLTLEIVPEAERFHGVASIDVELRKPTALIWLNGSELTVREASVTWAGRKLPARIVAGGEHFLGLAVDENVGPGPASLHLDYEGKTTRRETEGVFAQKEGEDWYVLTQFEATSARRAFPCFDEPGYKIPWRVSLKVKREHRALSNAPQQEEADAGEGMKTVTFAETRPLPSYLVAFAVGPFDVADAGTAGRKKTQIRIFTPRGRAATARWAALATPKILELVEDYFDMPYPYEKLDQVAIPLARFAMENPGLVTYGQRIMLRPPAEESVRFRRAYVNVCAHEIAHQWFGDLVTLGWWDDTWLNESFANWLGRKITDRFEPRWNVSVSRADSRSGALGSDTLASARKIRQPILSNDDIENAFDTITYAKGEAVLEMFESYLGEGIFRKAVQRYLREHAWGNATASDFLGALSAEAGRDMSGPVSSFLDQTGAPQVRAVLTCPADGPPRLALSQIAFRPLGSRGDAQKTWRVPVCAAYGTAGSHTRACTMLTGPTGELVLPAGTPCPEWIFPNADLSGYYLTDPSNYVMAKPDGGHDSFLSDNGPLSVADRVGILGDLGVQMTSGEVSLGEILASMSTIVGEGANLSIVRKTISRVEAVDELVPETLRPKYAAFVRSLYGARARRVGWEARPNEDDETQLLRPALLSIVGIQGEDRRIGKQAIARARRWLEGRGSLDPDLVGITLTLAARAGDGELFDQFHAAAKTTQDRGKRRLLLSALGEFRSARIARRALAVCLQEDFDPRESREILSAMRGDPATRQLAYDFLKEHFDEITAKLPRDAGAGLPRAATGFCDPEHRKDVEDFFRPRAAQFPGGPRVLDQVIERIDLCAARRGVLSPSLAAFLQSYGTSRIASN